MKKFIFYLARILSLLLVGFFGLFTLEGFSPGFSWIDSLAHGVLTLLIGLVTVLVWKKKKIGGLVFVLFGLFILLFFVRGHWFGGIVMSFVPLLIGILFLLESYYDKQGIKTR